MSTMGLVRVGIKPQHNTTLCSVEIVIHLTDVIRESTNRVSVNEENDNAGAIAGMFLRGKADNVWGKRADLLCFDSCAKSKQK